jgi:hypothetical protein
MSSTDRDQWLAGLRPAIQNWIEEQCRIWHEPRLTHSYADLILAFGLAWLGKAADDCHRLIDEAQRGLEPSWDEAHAFLFHAYQYRLGQALTGQDVYGSLPAELLKTRGQLSGQCEAGDWRRLENLKLSYVIDRLRASSEILEPLGGLNSYREELSPRWERSREVWFLPDIADSTELTRSIQKLLAACAVRPPSDQAELLKVALRRCPTVEGTVARDLLICVAPVLKQLTNLWDQGALLEAALAAAAHLRNAGHTKEFLAILMSLPHSERGVQLSENTRLVSQSVRTLRKLGLWQDMEHVLERFEQLILHDESPAQFRNRLQQLSSRARKAKAPLPSFSFLSLPHIAGGWLDLGQRERASRILDEMEDLLLLGHLPPHHLMDLPSAYVRVLGRLPDSESMRRTELFFRQLKANIDPRFSTNTHYALRQLQVVESVVLATTAENRRFLPPSPTVENLQ